MYGLIMPVLHQNLKIAINFEKKMLTFAVSRLHFHGLTSYGQLNSFGAESQKKWIWFQIMGSILRHDGVFFLRTRYILCMIYVRVWSSAYYSAYKNGRMVVAGGRPNVAIESAVAGCQLRYHAPLLTNSLPLFHAKQTNTLALSRMPKK